MSGGSGGYIYINARQEISKSKLDYKASVEAIGGYGKNDGLGGAGGVVHYDGEFSLGLSQTHTQGGLGGLTYTDSEPKGCSNGAAGSTFWSVYDAL